MLRIDIILLFFSDKTLLLEKRQLHIAAVTLIPAEMIFNYSSLLKQIIYSIPDAFAEL